MSEVRALPRERFAFGEVEEIRWANFFRVDPSGSIRSCSKPPRRVEDLMGSLVKKRRKRMRKKKHRKMLKRTRFQRRAAGK